MGILSSTVGDISKLLRWETVVGIFLIALLFKSWNHGKTDEKSGIPHAELVPYHLPLGLDMAWNLITRLRSNTFVEYVCDELLNTRGRTVEMKLLGKNIFITDRAENIKAIQADQFVDFAKGQTPHDVFSSILGDSVFTTDGDLWKTSREQLEPHVSRVRSDDIPTAEVHMQKLLTLIKSSSPAGVDVYDVIDRFQLDLVSQVFLGESANSLDAVEPPFRKAMEELLTYNTNRLLFGGLANLFPDWLFVPKAYRDLTRYIDGLIERTLALPCNQAESKIEEEFNLVEDLVATHPNDRYFIRGQLIAVLMASKDPGAILCTWTIYHLARQPDMFNKLQQEIKQHIGFDTIPTIPQLRKLDLLANVVKETMRMYHPLGLNIREADRSVTLPVGGGPAGNGPISVSAGQTIVYSVAGLQRNKDKVGNDANEWDPTRWEGWSPKFGDYLPFSIGPRQCPGRVFGRFQIQYVMVRLLQEFEHIEWCGFGGDADKDEEKMKIKVELNLKCAEPVMCRFTPRKSATAREDLRA